MLHVRIVMFIFLWRMFLYLNPHASKRDITRPEPLQFDAEHYRKLYTCFSLFSVLYLPEPGFEDVPIGDELMEWLNTHFIEPSTQEGDDLSSQERPWEDPGFWSYLTRQVRCCRPSWDR